MILRKIGGGGGLFVEYFLGTHFQGRLLLKFWGSKDGNVVLKTGRNAAQYSGKQFKLF